MIAPGSSPSRVARSIWRGAVAAGDAGACARTAAPSGADVARSVGRGPEPGGSPARPDSTARRGSAA